MSSPSSSSPVAFVTGSSRGLGRAIALRLARDGFDVVVHYRSEQAAAAEVVAAIAQTGRRAFAVQGDISSVAAVRRMFAELDAGVASTFGRAGFDVLVNNAGLVVHKPVGEWTEEEYDRQFNGNFKGPFFIIQESLPRLRDGGRIINLGTGLTRFSTYPGYGVYAATKGAIDVLTQHLAVQLGPRGITVNTLAPGAIDTDINAGWLRSEQGRQAASATAALGRVGQPEDIGDVASFLASPDSRWVTGQRIEASGGAHL